MCLSKVERIYKGTSRKVRKGYKIFRCYDERLVSLFSTIGQVLPEDLWLDERDYRVLFDLDKLEIADGTSYPVGWHILVSREDAIDLAFSIRFGKGWDEDCSLVVSEVYCKGLLAKGVENNRAVEVYRYIKISENAVWTAS